MDRDPSPHAPTGAITVSVCTTCKAADGGASTGPALVDALRATIGTAALASFVQSYRVTIYGLVPWRERADVLRKGMVARIPPAHWSPDDGRAPT